MAKEIKLAALKREGTGTSRVRGLRREGWVPAVVYNEKGESTALQVNAREFDGMLHHHASENLIVDLDVQGLGMRKVLLREVQHHPVRGHALHADFLEVSMTRKMRVTVRVECVGEPMGVSQQGGILEHVLRDVDIECLPGDIPDQITVDVSAMNVGDTLQVRDLVVDSKLTVLTSGDVAVATVVMPKAEAVEEAAAAEGATAEPELIGKKKAEEEEGEGEGAPAKEEKKEKKEG